MTVPVVRGSSLAGAMPAAHEFAACLSWLEKRCVLASVSCLGGLRDGVECCTLPLQVWDYASDGYVHRLVQSKSDGKLVEVPSPGPSSGE